MFEVGSLVKTRYTARVGVVLQQDNVEQDNVDRPAETQILVGGNKEWFETRHLRLISGTKK